MSITGNRKLVKQLLEKADLQEPFLRDEGKLFLKFDRIDFDPYPSPHLVYYWRGKETLRMPVPGHNPYNVLTIGGIDGRTEIYFTD